MQYPFWPPGLSVPALANDNSEAFLSEGFTVGLQLLGEYRFLKDEDTNINRMENIHYGACVWEGELSGMLVKERAHSKACENK